MPGMNTKNFQIKYNNCSILQEILNISVFIHIYVYFLRCRVNIILPICKLASRSPLYFKLQNNMN